MVINQYLGRVCTPRVRDRDRFRQELESNSDSKVSEQVNANDVVPTIGRGLVLEQHHGLKGGLEVERPRAGGVDIAHATHTTHG